MMGSLALPWLAGYAVLIGREAISYPPRSLRSDLVFSIVAACWPALAMNMLINATADALARRERQR